MKGVNDIPAFFLYQGRKNESNLVVTCVMHHPVQKPFNKYDFCRIETILSDALTQIRKI